MRHAHALLTAMLALAAAPAPAEAPRPPVVTVATAVSQEIAETLTVTGTLVAREEIVVGVDISGYRILELHADEGDEVEGGQLLAVLDPTSIEIEAARNEAARARAEAAVAQAESHIVETEAAKVEADAALERARKLTDRGFAAADALETRIAVAAVAAAKLASARQGLLVARAEQAQAAAEARDITLRLSRTSVVAPRGGVVLQRGARVGAVVGMEGAPLFRIARDGLVELEAEVTESDLARIRVGMAVSVTPPGSDAPIAGEVRRVPPSVDAATRLGLARIALPRDPGLRVGAFARGRVEIARRTGVVVPAAALTDGASLLAVVDGHAVRRVVQTGLRDGQRVEIVSGLSAGDVVVARAGVFLRDGDAVTSAPELAEVKP